MDRSNRDMTTPGYNNNNFNRRDMPSNIVPMNGGMLGDPIERYNPMTTTANIGQFANMAQTSNFNQAYQPNSPFVEKINYANRNNLIYNNVGENTLDEHLVEYKLNIDSMDRDIKYYPDPFEFIVKLGPTSGKTYDLEKYVDPHDKNQGTRIIHSKLTGTPTPHILKKFINVKYVKLENIILPQYSKSIYDDASDKYIFDIESHMPSDRFVMLVIDELDDERMYTTSEDTSRLDQHGNPYTPPVPFSVVLPDRLLGLNFYSGNPFFGSKIYKNSVLGNLDKLTIRLYDSNGLPLKYNNLWSYDKLVEYEHKHKKPFPITDLRHPYNKRIQVYMTLIIGVVETQINTNTKYAQ